MALYCWFRGIIPVWIVNMIGIGEVEYDKYYSNRN